MELAYSNPQQLEKPVGEIRMEGMCTVKLKVLFPVLSGKISGQWNKQTFFFLSHSIFSPACAITKDSNLELAAAPEHEYLSALAPHRKISDSNSATRFMFQTGWRLQGLYSSTTISKPFQ